MGNLPELQNNSEVDCLINGFALGRFTLRKNELFLPI